ncbi:MAG TPA: DUF2306 domain-containing protein [Gammaproteobacteria bacterium]|jgi:uncharacterized membrane protein|nr:DUF2306 domain-containing protein [Gammaproteobacteria bacterium]
MRWFTTPARWFAKGFFTLTSLAVAGYAFTFLYRAFQVGSPFAAQFAVSGWDVPFHFFMAGSALALGPLQLAGTIRRRWPRLHRTLGWLYALDILIGAAAGFSLSFNAQGGLASGLGFATLALLWPAVTARGVWLAVRGDATGHRRWMCRSVALTYAAVTLRLMLGIGAGAMSLPFMTVYITAAWSSWPINLAVCELIIRWPVIRAQLARDVADRRWVSRSADV